MAGIEELRNVIVNGDCLEVLKGLPDSSIDLAVTSPPYNLAGALHAARGESRAKKSKWTKPPLLNGYSGHDDDMPHGEYVAWQRDVIFEVMRALKDDGALFYNHKWHIRKGRLLDRHDIVDGFPVRQIIIWQRSGGINFVKTHFLPTYEVIYLIAKKDYRLVDGANKLTDVWRIDQERHSDHPAPFPVELPSRAIASSLSMAREGSIVLDPFMGSGTTAVAALMHGKDYIGIEQSAEYCRMAEERVADERGRGRLLLEGEKS